MRAPIAVVLLFAACTTEATPPSSGAPTYWGATKALLDTHCGACHVNGGIAPFALDTYASAKTYATLAAEAVRTRRMPPWLPDTRCRHYVSERALPQGDIDTIVAWAAGGALEGDPSTAAAAQGAPPLPEPTLSLRAVAPYTPRTDRPDDYRCFPLEHTFDHEVYLSRSVVQPGVRKQVHHVLLYLVQAQYASEIERVDSADPGSGYTCFGGPGIGLPETIGAWVPGGPPSATPGDAAIRIPKGARIIMQLHYNTLSGGPEPDQSQVDLWLSDTPPTHLITVKPLAHLGLSIAVNDPSSVQSRVYTNRDAEPWRIIAVAPHMHMLGERIQVRALSATETRCMIDIPHWDFGWQQSYRFLPGEEVTIPPGDSIRVDCTYDNSPANQPVVGGAKLPSRAVTWGEGTLDEMCLAYVMMVTPFVPLPVVQPGDACPGFQACYDACRQQPNTIAMGCALQCSAASRSDCPKCVLSSVVACTIDDCVQPIDAFLQCLESCNVDPSDMGCVARTCVPVIIAMDTCAAPMISSGACDALTASCGADL